MSGIVKTLIRCQFLRARLEEVRAKCIDLQGIMTPRGISYKRDPVITGGNRVTWEDIVCTKIATEQYCYRLEAELNVAIKEASTVLDGIENPVHRAVLRELYLYGTSIGQIAAKLKIPKRTAYWIKSNALRIVSDSLDS